MRQHLRLRRSKVRLRYLGPTTYPAPQLHVVRSSAAAPCRRAAASQNPVLRARRRDARLFACLRALVGSGVQCGAARLRIRRHRAACSLE